MAGPYSDTEKKKYLEQVKKLLGQDYSLNAACRQVAERNGGRPSATSLAKWAKTAGLHNDAGTAPVPLETTHTEGRSDQGAEPDGNTSIASDPPPENDAQGQMVPQEPELFTDNAGSEARHAPPVALVDTSEEMEVVRERTPRRRGMVTTVSEKIRALRNLVKGHLGR